MRNESSSVNDQGGSIAQLLASDERELCAFVTAVNQLFDAEQGRKAAENWIEELERTDWPNGASVIDWRKVTIGAADRLVGKSRGLCSQNAISKEQKMSTISNTVAIPADDPRRNLLVQNPDNSNVQHLGVVGDTYTTLLSGTDTAGRFTLIDMHVPPGGGPPPHRHDSRRALFFSTANCKLPSEGRSVLCALEKRSTFQRTLLTNSITPRRSR
jgi:hypothetical protein